MSYETIQGHRTVTGSEHSDSVLQHNCRDSSKQIVTLSFVNGFHNLWLPGKLFPAYHLPRAYSTSTTPQTSRVSLSCSSAASRPRTTISFNSGLILDVEIRLNCSELLRFKWSKWCTHTSCCLWHIIGKSPWIPWIDGQKVRIFFRLNSCVQFITARSFVELLPHLWKTLSKIVPKG